MPDKSPEHNEKNVSWFGQLLHKRVFQTLAIYIAIGWGGTEILLAVQDTLGFPDWISRLAMAVFIAGIPVAAFLAWAHDINSRAIRILLRSVAIVVLVTGAVLMFQQSRAPGPPDASVAILPFVDMSPDAGQSWLVDALAEDLRNSMARAGDLLVIAATSSNVFRGRTDELDAIREELNVRHVLSGSVRQDGGMLRITTNLIDTVTGRHVWSDRYDLPAENLFEIEDRIVDRIGGSLSVTLAPQDADGGTRDLAAFEAYQRAHESESWESRQFSYDEAVRIDPNFAWPLIEKAAYYAFRVTDGFLSAEKAWAEAVPLLERAQAINENIYSIYTVYGMLNTFRGNYQEAQSNYERSLELNPNDAWTYGVYGLLMRWGLGQFEQAVTLHERNAQVDPLDYTANLQLGTSYWRVQRHDDARRQYEKAIRICPSCGIAYQSYSGMLSEGLGRVDEGLAVRYRMFAELDEEPTPRQLGGTAGGHSLLADMETALKYITATMSLVPEGRFDEFLIPFYLGLGKLDEARKIAEPYLQSTKAAPPWVVNTLGRVDLDQGEPESALERYRSVAPELFDDPPDVKEWSGLLTFDLFRVLVAAGQETRLLRILEEMERTLPDEYRVFQLLYAGRLNQAIAMVREEYPDGVIHPRYCKSLQDELPWLPGSIDAENPELQALIEDACAERERQLANVRRGFESGEYRLPEIVLKAKPASDN